MKNSSAGSLADPIISYADTSITRRSRTRNSIEQCFLTWALPPLGDFSGFLGGGRFKGGV